MSVILDERTVAMIESRMKEFGFDSPDELIQVALDHLDGERGVDYEDLDAETRAAIAEADGQGDIPWDQAMTDLNTRIERNRQSQNGMR